MLIAFKLKLAMACAAGLAGPLAVAPLVSDRVPNGGAAAEPAMVEIAPGALSYRAAGEFTQGGRVVEAPLWSVRFAKPVSIMTQQVSSADYQACVDDGACHAFERDAAIAADHPAVQVSWHDANDYAAWLSRRTGAHYRLPTDQEWAFAAGSRFVDDGVPIDAGNPARRWIDRYDREAGRDSDAALRPFGAFGSNENGVADLSGNVWEWTATCFTRSVLDMSGAIAGTHVNCGVRIAEGAHRAYVTDFIRDARAGGCAAGTPPDNLGFRLVRDEAAPAARVAARLGSLLAFARR